MVGSCNKDTGNEYSTHSGDNFNAERWDNCVAEVKDGTFNKTSLRQCKANVGMTAQYNLVDGSNPFKVFY